LGLASAARPAEQSDLGEVIYEVVLNEADSGPTLVLLQDERGALWIDADDLARLRLKPVAGQEIDHDGRPYWPLSAISHLQVRVDASRCRVYMQAPPEDFMPTLLAAAERSQLVITPAAFGAFLNYQLSAQRINTDSTTGAFAELGVYAAPGVFTQTAAARSGDFAGSAVLRLDSTVTHDMPDRIERLILGDDISDPGSWGSTLHFAGIGWGRDFALRPDVLTMPLLTASGAAVVPSTVDVLVNNQPVSSQNLSPGPFVIDRLPAISGPGEITLVVRDALGREETVTQSFYASPNLLAPGLSQYAVNLGAVRENYALASDDYGPLLGAATYRRGLTASLTAELHGEYLNGGPHAVGFNVASGVAQLGVLNLTAAIGGAPGSSGTLLGASLEHQGRIFSLTAGTSVASLGYRQLEDAGSQIAQFKQRTLAQAGLNLGQGGSVYAAFVAQNYFFQPSVRTATLGYNLTVHTRDSLSLTLNRTTTGNGGGSGPVQNGFSVFLNFTIPLDERRSLSFDGTGGNGNGAPVQELYATALQNAPVGAGFGYRAGISSRGNYLTDGRWQSAAGDLELQAAKNLDVSGQSATWSGAATLLDGELRAARSVTDSFAAVDVAGLPDIPVYVDNQLVTQTDAQGYALLHQLRPYEPNRISIDPLQLPLDTQIDSPNLVLAPGYRSGVIAQFAVKRVKAATFRLVLPSGAPVPAGAQIKFNGRIFAAGLDGITYVTGYDHGMGGQAIWGQGQCEFRVEPPSGNDPQPDLGTLRCQPVRAAQVSLP
jgi:outer membrane usher protein